MKSSRTHLSLVPVSFSTLAIVFASLLALVLLPVAAGAAETPQTPIKIGHLSPVTGPFAEGASFITAGLEIGFEEVGYKVGGRTIRVLTEDTEFKADVALTKTRKLIERDKVNIIVGPVNSAGALAIRDYVVGKNIPVIVTQATATQLIKSEKPPRVFRPNYSSPQIQYEPGRYFYSKMGYKQIAIVGFDHVAGREHVEGFKKGFEDAGGKVVQEIYIPVGTADHAPYIGKIGVDKVNAVNVILWGIDAIRFLKQAKDFGLKEKVPIIAYGSGVIVEGMSMPALGKDVLGIVNYSDYAYNLETNANKRLVSAVKKKLGKDSNYLAANGYTAARIIVEAIKAVRGSVEDVPRFYRAIQAVEFDGPAGKFKFDEYGQTIITLYIREPLEKDGGIYNKILDTIPNVKHPY